MKRRDFDRHLAQHGCELRREGGNHSIYVNKSTRRVAAVPRHVELKAGTVRKICKVLEIAELGTD